jgi:hypothetical protein
MKREIEKRIKRQRTELDEIDAEIDATNAVLSKLQIKRTTAEAVLNELDSLLKILPKEEDEPEREKQIRFGTDVYKARDILRIFKKPLYVGDILSAMGEEPTADRRRSLASQIAAYVRDNQIFTRPEPNTFGLKEFENQSSEQMAKIRSETDADAPALMSLEDDLSENKGGAVQGEIPDFPF